MEFRRPTFAAGIAVCLSVLFTTTSAQAQPLGTFAWQLQPFCNIVRLAVVQQGGQYQLDGTDDQCGIGRQASVTGLAFVNPDGTIGFGLNLVTAPGGLPVHVDATISLATLSGTWRDSAGAAGAFVLTPGAGVAGNPRPLPGVGTGDITGVTAGAGLAGGGVSGEVALAVNFATTQQRVTGACGAGTFVAGVNQDGTVTCAASTGAGGGDITDVIAGAGLIGGSASGSAALAVAFAGPGTANSVARSDHTHAGLASGVTAVGANALGLNTTGTFNTAVGQNALSQNSTAAQNTAIGAFALWSNQTGASNTATGRSALQGNTTGFGNTAVGANALQSNTTGILNTGVGLQALLSVSTGGNNVAVGAAALAMTTTGTWNVAVGAGALQSNQTSSSNVAVGDSALIAATGGDRNTAVGAGVMSQATQGLFNTALGAGAMGSSSTSSYNTAIGMDALHDNLAGTDNVALGLNALTNNAASFRNTALGAGAMQNSPSGTDNVAVGQTALFSNTGNNNLAFGNGAGSALTSGNNNLYLGTDGGQATESNATYIRNVSGSTSSGGASVFVNGAGKLGTLTSSIRFKEDVQAIGDVRDAIQALRPVSFYYKAEFDDGSRVQQYGLIAEEVAEVMPGLVIRDAKGEIQTVRYHFLTPLLLADVQRLERERTELTRLVATQAAGLTEQAAAIAELRAMLDELRTRLR